MSRSLSRALSILELYNSKQSEWGITEMGQEIDLPKSTVHGLVKTLESHGFLEITEHSKYRLGIKVYELGLTYQTSARLSTVAEPWVKMLAEKYRQSVHIAIYAGRMAVFVIGNKSGTGHVIFPRIGAGIAAYCTGVGKALLAWQSDTHLEEYLKSEVLVPFTKNTIVEPDKLKEELQSIKKQGYALDKEETVVGIGCAAAPIFGFSDHIIAAISISGIADIILEEKMLDGCIHDVRNAARAISVGMGYRE